MNLFFLIAFRTCYERMRPIEIADVKVKQQWSGALKKTLFFWAEYQKENANTNTLALLWEFSF